MFCLFGPMDLEQWTRKPLLHNSVHIYNANPFSLLHAFGLLAISIIRAGKQFQRVRILRNCPSTLTYRAIWFSIPVLFIGLSGRPCLRREMLIDCEKRSQFFLSCQIYCVFGVFSRSVNWRRWEVESCSEDACAWEMMVEEDGADCMGVDEINP